MKEFIENWISALKSGDYKQGNQVLYNSENDTYCCLGVGCELLDVNHELMDEIGLLEDVPTDINIGILNKYGLLLSALNDGSYYNTLSLYKGFDKLNLKDTGEEIKMTFEEIAEIIPILYEGELEETS